MALYLRIASYLKPHAPTVLAGVVAAAAYSVFDAAAYILLIPFVDTLFVSGGASMGVSESPMQDLLDATVHRWVDLSGDPLDAIGHIIILLVLVLFAKNVFAVGRTYLLARAEQGVSRDLRNAAYDRVLELDLGFFVGTRPGQVLSRLTTEVELLRTLVTREASRMVSSLFEFSVALLAMLLISWRLTLAAFVVIPAAMAVWSPLVGLLRRRDRRVLDLGGEVSARIVETLGGIRLVKSTSSEARERRRFHLLTGEYFKRFLRAESVRAFAAPMTEMLAAAGTVILLWYGGRLVVAGDVTGAQFVGFLGLSLKLYAPVKSVAKFPATAQPGLVAAERVFELLDTSVTVQELPHAKAFASFESEIAFEEVGFAYGAGRTVLSEVSFTVPKGNVFALVGSSGAGKTTIVDLLSRFFDPSSGTVRIDGWDLRDLAISDVRGLMGVVSQETILLHDTVRANISYGRPGASADEVVAAAEAANAHDFIERMEEGYDTVVGERGMRLSAGERQRLAIARALLRDPAILIFDEATSALDAESERLVQGAVETLMDGRTVLVVAHRLATIRRADQILVVEGGRIVERGPHDALVAARGRYRQLYDLQFRDGTGAPATADLLS
jgi:subfamily B ATP-binding cassette protein MsbA